MRRDKDDRREVMKKFTFKGVLDNFRNSVAQPPRAEQEIQETLKVDHFQVKRVSGCFMKVILFQQTFIFIKSII